MRPAWMMRSGLLSSYQADNRRSVVYRLNVNQLKTCAQYVNFVFYNIVESGGTCCVMLGAKEDLNNLCDNGS